MSLLSLSARGPYRSNSGLILGVAKGLAVHYNLSPLTVRFLILLSTVLLFFWPTIILYIVCGFIMPREPEVLLMSERDKGVWILGQADPQVLVNGLGRRADEIEKRLRRMEDYVTSRAYSTRKDYS